MICSYQFARNKAADVHHTNWDVVVMDEALRLRNVYKTSNVIANTLKQALAEAPKILLTATPLQNSLLELFGLVSIIDDQVFGDLRSFREQFSDLSQAQVFDTLKRRLAPVCHRTLRRQVTAYVSYTRRLPLVEQFTPDESEDQLYNLVSDYLRRDNLQALPSGQRTLMTLVMRKLLASSSFAIAGALNTLARRLKAVLAKQGPANTLLSELDEDYELLDETADEWYEDAEPVPALSAADQEALRKEIADLDSFRDLATSITRNAKGAALLKALRVAFDKAAELGGARKAIIFTESRKTQLYLQRLLADSPWKDGTVLFNGSNTDEQSRGIYAEWRARHEGTDRISGSKTADMRSALVEYFKDRGEIMIATEAGAEGINLQFCSLVVNYDLAEEHGFAHGVVVPSPLGKAVGGRDDPQRSRREGRLRVAASSEEHGAVGGDTFEQIRVLEGVLGGSPRDQAPEVVVVPGQSSLRRCGALPVGLLVDQSYLLPEGTLGGHSADGEPGAGHLVGEDLGQVRRDLRRGGGLGVGASAKLDLHDWPDVRRSAHR